MTAAQGHLAHRRLVAHLIESGALSADWRPAFEAVPRAEFIPRRCGSRARAVSWCHCAAAPGQRVLEIGTGTGYNAALLAQRLGAENVVTIEIDSELAHTARNALKTTGCDAVTVVTGDGAQPRLTLTADDDAHATHSTTDTHPAEIANGHVAFDACIALAILVPHCAMSYAPPEFDTDGEGTLWLVDTRSASWARLHHHPDRDGPYRVLQSGSRHLWDEVHTSYHWWLDAGRPTANHWLFTITPHGQHIQLLGR